MGKQLIIKILLIFFLTTNSLLAGEIYFYIGSAFIKPAKEIAKLYEKSHKNSNVLIISGGSKILLQKILLSKKGDIYLPGAELYKTLAEKKGIVLFSKDFIKQIPVFALSKRGEKKIFSFKDLCKKNIKIALGNENTMALGKIYVKIKEKFPDRISECIEKNCVIKGTNVAQIANYIKMNIVDAGVVFESVANLFKFKIINIPEKYNVVDKAPLILLKFSKNKSFFNFIIKNKMIFEKYGYKC